MENQTSTATLPRRLFDAIERADLDAVRRLYAEDVEVWNNVQKTPMKREENLKLLELFTGRMKDLRYEVLDIHEFPGGCVDRHILRGTTRSGAPIEAHVSIVFHTDGRGRIVRLFEYLDAASVAKVFEG